MQEQTINNKNQSRDSDVFLSDLPDRDRQLMSLLDDLPAVHRPWGLIAEHIGISQDALLAKVNDWHRSGRLRQIRPFFNNDRLGYESTLAATAVSESEADEVASVIAQLPAVSHNFLRSGAELNLWFTLTCPTKTGGVAAVADQLGATLDRPIRRFDVITHYKIGFRALFHRTRPAWHDWIEVPQEMPYQLLMDIIEILQAGVPLVERPYAALAEGRDFSESDVIAALVFLKKHKVIRRLGSLWHFSSIAKMVNVMCAWDAPAEDLDPLGRHAAREGFVSHSYRRACHGDWPWKIYTMIHGKDHDNCLALIDGIAVNFPRATHMELWTVKQFKQSPVKLDRDEIVLKL